MKTVTVRRWITTLGAVAAAACAPDDPGYPPPAATGGAASGGSSGTGGIPVETGGTKPDGGGDVGAGGLEEAAGTAGTGDPTSGAGTAGADPSSGGEAGQPTHVGGEAGSGNQPMGSGGGSPVATGGTGEASGGAATGASPGTAGDAGGDMAAGAGGAPGGAGGQAPSTGGAAAGTGGESASTGGVPAGTGGAPPVVCPNADPSLISIAPSRRVNAACNNAGITGWWYCFDDGINATSCTELGAPYSSASGAMCLSGSTTAASAAWGAGIGVSLNQASGTTAPKLPFDATALTPPVTGFRITLTGNTGGLPVRLTLTNLANPAGSASPFVEVAGVAGTSTEFDLIIADAVVPIDWDVANAGAAAIATLLYDLQVQIAGGAVGAYDFCITQVQLL